jgi:hypothetical protein
LRTPRRPPHTELVGLGDADGVTRGEEDGVGLTLVEGLALGVDDGVAEGVAPGILDAVGEALIGGGVGVAAGVRIGDGKGVGARDGTRVGVGDGVGVRGHHQHQLGQPPGLPPFEPLCARAGAGHAQSAIPTRRTAQTCAVRMLTSGGAGDGRRLCSKLRRGRRSSSCEHSCSACSVRAVLQTELTVWYDSERTSLRLIRGGASSVREMATLARICPSPELGSH